MISASLNLISFDVVFSERVCATVVRKLCDFLTILQNAYTPQNCIYYYLLFLYSLTLSLSIHLSFPLSFTRQFGLGGICRNRFRRRFNVPYANVE